MLKMSRKGGANFSGAECGVGNLNDSQQHGNIGKSFTGTESFHSSCL